MLYKRAYAKLNLSLDVTGRRADGYHFIDSVFHTISLCDTVSVQRTDADITVICTPPLPAGSDCIATRTARAFFAASSIAGGAFIEIEKRIPFEAGMGGGSADAAAVLSLLNELYGSPLTAPQLAQVGLTIGSDVPFSLAGGTCRVTGIGERTFDLYDIKPLHFIVAKPTEGLSTKVVYQQFDTPHTYTHPQTERVIEALVAGDLHAYAQAAGNSLQATAEQMVPAVAAYCQRLREEGAVYAAMTGSGSAVFGVFPSRQASESALQRLTDLDFAVLASSVSA